MSAYVSGSGTGVTAVAPLMSIKIACEMLCAWPFGLKAVPVVENWTLVKPMTPPSNR